MADITELVALNRFRQTRLVLEAGGDPNCRNSVLETPLMTCVVNILDDDRRAVMMKMLLAFGADVNLQNDKGQTVLMYACIFDKTHVFLTLIENEDINLNMQDSTGNTALMYACALGRSSMVFSLLEEKRSYPHRLDIYLTNQMGKTALQIASDRNITHIVDMFSEVIDRDYYNKRGELGAELLDMNGGRCIAIKNNEHTTTSSESSSDCTYSLIGNDISSPSDNIVDSPITVTTATIDAYNTDLSCHNEIEQMKNLAINNDGAQTNRDGIFENCTDYEKLAWNQVLQSRDSPFSHVRRSSGIKFPDVRDNSNRNTLSGDNKQDKCLLRASYKLGRSFKHT